jgi:hypothetical protein
MIFFNSFTDNDTFYTGRVRQVCSFLDGLEAARYGAVNVSKVILPTVVNYLPPVV